MRRPMELDLEPVVEGAASGSASSRTGKKRDRFPDVPEKMWLHHAVELINLGISRLEGKWLNRGGSSPEHPTNEQLHSSPREHSMSEHTAVAIL